MTTLTSEDFGLVLGDLVIAKIAAINEKGQGLFSKPNSVGALVQTLPQAPPNPPRRGHLTNEFRIHVEWDFLTTYEQRGGSTIDSYELQIDDGAGGYFVEVCGFT